MTNDFFPIEPDSFCLLLNVAKMPFICYSLLSGLGPLFT
jgi:hypothetical protein